MRKRWISNILLIVVVLAFARAAIAAMSSVNYSLEISVLSNGGTTMDSAAYQMTATIGQSSCIGLSSKWNYTTYVGFWQPDKLEIKRRALPWIPLLLGD